MALLGPKMAEHGRLADVPKWSKKVQNDPNDKSNMVLTIWGQKIARFWPKSRFYGRVMVWEVSFLSMSMGI